jgi:D-amino peptidase
VKQSITRYSARSISPELARGKIREAAKRAVERAPSLKPYRPDAPYELEIDFVNSACADAAELVPGTTRVNGLTTRYSVPDGDTLIRVIQAWTILAGSTIV